MPEAYRSSAYGLVIALPARVRALRTAPPQEPIDVTVTYGHLPVELPGAVESDEVADFGWRRYADAEGRVLWTTDRARYLIEGGDRVVIDRSAAEGNGLQFVIWFALPALLMQRGKLVLHATTVATDDVALCIAGQSGAGKSTLATALIERGLRLVSDDVTAVDLDDQGNIVVLPGHTHYSLHETMQSRMRPPATLTRRIPGPRGKVALWAPPEVCVDEQRRLAAVIALRRGPSESMLETIPLTGVAKAQAVLGNAYLPILLTLRPDGFPVLPKLLSDIPIIEVQRPPDTWTVDELADWALTLLEE